MERYRFEGLDYRLYYTAILYMLCPCRFGAFEAQLSRTQGLSPRKMVDCLEAREFRVL